MSLSTTQLVIGQYVPLDSPVHKLNPVLKLVVTILLMTSVFVFSSPADYALLFGAWLMVLKLSRLPLKFVLKGFKPIMFLVLITFLLHVWMGDGAPYVSIGPISLSRPAVFNACYFVARLLLVVGFTSLLTLTTSAIELTFAMEKLTKPFKRLGFPAEEFSMMLTISLRFIPVLFREMDKIMKAQMCRGADFKSGDLKTRASNYLALLVPLFANAFKRALDLALAMEVRCYETDTPRTTYREYSFGTGDKAAVLAVSALMILMAWLKFGSTLTLE